MTVAGAVSASAGSNCGSRFDAGSGLMAAGMASDDVDHEREKSSAGSGSARSAGGSIS